jgi:hypothetical protein
MRRESGMRQAVHHGIVILIDNGNGIENESQFSKMFGKSSVNSSRS